jgi:protein arginine kinase
MAESFSVEGNSEPLGTSQSNSGGHGNRVFFQHFQIEVGSRISVSRNLAAYPFFDACSSQQRLEIQAKLNGSAWVRQNQAACQIIDVQRTKHSEQQFLTDLQSVVGLRLAHSSHSAELTLDGLPASMDSDGPIRLVQNDEDHLRIEIENPGNRLNNLWRQASLIDDQLQLEFGFAFHPQFGFLTASPANAGTGLRADVMLHLPALIAMGTFPQLQARLARQNVAIRESFGVPGSGDFFRVRNHSTLGLNEEQLVGQVAAAVAEIVEAEQQARTKWRTFDLQGLKRELNQALSELESMDFSNLEIEKLDDQLRWPLIGSLSKMRLGLQLGILNAIDGARVAGRFQMLQLKSLLNTAIANEDYRTASRIRDRIKVLGEAG